MALKCLISIEMILFVLTSYLRVVQDVLRNLMFKANQYLYLIFSPCEHNREDSQGRDGKLEKLVGMQRWLLRERGGEELGRGDGRT